MPRIRTIKPEFWTNERLCGLPICSHVLAAALLNHADDEGYLNANPDLLRAAVFPLRETSGTVPVMLQELSSVGFITLHEGSDGRTYIHVSKFLKHQVINKPKPSKIKDLIVGPVAVPDEYGIDTVSVPGGMERGTGNVEQGMDQGVVVSADAEPDPVTLQAREVIASVKKTHGWPWRKPHRFLTARLRDGATVAECLAVVAVKSDEWTGTDSAKYLRQETLFSEGKFEGYLQQASAARAPTGSYGPECRKQVATGEEFEFDGQMLPEMTGCVLTTGHEGKCAPRQGDRYD